ncbi:MAG: peptidoglycan bridge formation glycyltransferase FemA/FemB family protein [Candidatus Coprovivens sp.]
MKFTELDKLEFTQFVSEHETNNFFQSVKMMERLEKEGKEVYLVGIKENDKIVGASLIAATGHKFMGLKTFEAYKGFIIDYHNKELVKFMTDNCIKFLKSKGGLRLVIDPYIPNVSRDMEANVVPGIDNRDVKDYLYKLGYKDNDGAQVKWCYVLDINGKTSDELFNDFRSSTRNYINRTINKYKLNIKTLKRDELSEFKKVTSDTCDRRDFADKSLEYYENMYDVFGDDVTFKICELNCDTYINALKAENEEMERKILELSDSASNKKKKEVMRNDLLNNAKKIKETEELKLEKGNIIPLSAAMFMLYGPEIVYLFSGSYAEYMNFCGQYRLQWEMIDYAAKNGYKRYNFYGIQDVFNPQGKDYGVYEFKKGFGGFVEELLGSFEISISSKNNLYRLIKKIKHIVKK